MTTLSVCGVLGIGEIVPGEDLASLLCTQLNLMGVSRGQSGVLVVAQKAVSKSENRYVDLGTVTASARATQLSAATGKDPRLVELILSESSEVLRAAPGVLIVRHRIGYVMANAGIDQSNVGESHHVLLLPRDPDRSAARLQADIAAHAGFDLAVIIADSFGRPWRRGVTNVALGVAGLPALIDRRGELDRNGRQLQVTEVAFADQIASAAGLVMGEGSEGIPAALIRGLAWSAPMCPGLALLRPLAEDLFR